MDQISKIKVLDVLSVCLIRHESTNVNCMGCKYYGPDCIEVHKYAEVAVKCLKVKEVTNGVQRNEH